MGIDGKECLITSNHVKERYQFLDGSVSRNQLPFFAEKRYVGVVKSRKSVNLLGIDGPKKFSGTKF